MNVLIGLGIRKAKIRVHPQPERAWFGSEVVHRELIAELTAPESDCRRQSIVGRPQVQRVGRVDRGAKFALQPGAVVVGPFAHDTPWPPRDEAVDGVLFRRIVQRKLILLPPESESAVADAVREWEQ